MKKFVCSVCGYVYEGETAPEKCPAVSYTHLDVYKRQAIYIPTEAQFCYFLWKAS